MGFGASILLIAVGAVLAFAVEAEISGLDVQTVGWIILAVGVLGLLLSMLFWSSWGGPGGMRRGGRVVREDYVREEPPPP